MSYSISTSFALLFLATLLAAGTLYTAGNNAAERVVDAGGAELVDERQQLHTGFEIVEATYYAPDDRLVVDLRNTRENELAIPATDVIIDDTLRLTFAVRRVGSEADTEVWASGETLHLELEIEHPERLKVVTEHGIARDASLRPYSFYSVEWRMFGHDPSNSGRIDTPPLASNPTGAWNHSTSGNVRSSPAVVADTLYVGSDDGTLYALDADDGSTVWTETLDGTAIRSSPAVVEGRVYVGTDGGNLLALDAGNGSVLWNVSVSAEPIRASPTAINGTVYVGSDDGNVYAFDAADGSSRSGWPFSTGGQVRTTPAVVDGTVYFGSDDGTVYAVWATNGSERWTTSLNLLRKVRSSPAVVNGTVFVGTIDTTDTGIVGNLYALDASDGSEIWSESVQSRVSPAVAGDLVYAAGDGGVVSARFVSNGSVEWSFDMGNATESAPAVAGEFVYVADENGNVYALDASTGAKQWRFAPGGDVLSSPAVSDGLVYVGSDDGDVYALKEG